MSNTLTDLLLQASRGKWRYVSPRGELSTEQLWDLELTSPFSKVASLNSIAVALHQESISETPVSFIPGVQQYAPPSIASLKLQLVKEIINIRVNEAKAKEALLAESQKKQQDAEIIQQILAQREQDNLKALTTEQLKALLQK